MVDNRPAMGGKPSDIEVLREAIDIGHTEKVLDMLKLGVPIVIDQDGQTALHLAASAGHYEMVEALIQAGCDVGIQDFTGHTALQRASAEGHLDIIKTLVKNGVSVDHQDEVHGNTALHEASWKGFSQSVQYLCKSKANPYIKNRGGFAPLHLCCQNGHNETCRVLLLSGCKPDIKNNYGDTPLHTAARYGHAGVIRILVSAKCNTSEQNKNGDTALHIAAAMGRRKLTRVLLESGCDRNIKNKQSENAVEIAQRKNLSEVVQILQAQHQLRRPLPASGATDLPGKSVDDSDDLDAIHVDKSYNPFGPDQAMLPQQQYHNPQHKRERSSNSSQERPIKFDPRDKRRPRPIREGDKKERRRKKRYQYQDFEAMTSPYGLEQESEFPPPAEGEDLEPIEGEQYFMDLAGNIKRGPAPRGKKCACGPAFHKFEKKLDVDKRDIIEHIDRSHQVLDTRLAYLEKKTKDQIFGLNQAMKESFAQERGECLDRMDRRALRERIAIERQQVLRDMALKRDLALWLDAKLTDIERKHKLDAKNAALLRAMAIKRFSKYTKSAVPNTKSGTLRRAHSEELVSEVGLDGHDDNNNTHRHLDGLFPKHTKKKTKARDSSSHRLSESYNGLQVSDQPSRRRVRRNSAGDEISSILNHETSNGLIVMGSPLATSETLEESGSELNRHFYYNGSISQQTPAFDSDATLRLESSERASSRTSSSLNTTVVTKVDVSDRAHLYDVTPEQRLDFVVCDPGCRSEEQHLYYNHPGVIRPIPGRPSHSQQSTPPPPLPGPKPTHLRAQRERSQALNDAHEMAYDRRPAFPLPKDELSHHVQRELFPPYPYQNEDNLTYGTGTNHNLNGLPARPQYNQFAFNGHGMRSTSMKPMLAPLEEVDYVSRDQIEQNGTDFGSKADPDLHRQLLNIPMTSEGSHDSHNDSGYSTRLGFSAGPSPSLSGSRPESSDGDHPQYHNSQPQGSVALLDPMAISLMPPEFELPSDDPRLQDVQQQLQMSRLAENDSSKFAPKGSLV